MYLSDRQYRDTDTAWPERLPISLPLLISVVVPVHNGADTLGRCLEGIFASSYRRLECIVVDDCSTDDTEDIARRHGAEVLALGGRPRGPAFARNRGADAAHGEILFFVDADVVVHPDALARIAATLTRESEVAAVFGSYDETPGEMNLVSQYKNLAHHFVHQEGREEGSTFWSGCGAVRRDVFLAMGGFDEVRYPRPSIEDIDLGCRWRAAGRTIILDKGIQATHLKRWTLLGMTKSDVFDRAIPWTLLIMRERSLPNDLNLRLSQRVSALLLWSLLVGLGLATFWNVASATLLLLGALLLLVVGHWGWPEGTPALTSRKASLVAYPLLGVTVTLMLISRNTLAVLLLVPLGAGMVFGPHLPWIGPVWTGRLFAIVVLGIVAAFGLILLSLPTWLVAPTVFALGLILLLNFRFYVFFTQRRGPLFALAIVPIQLLYYFYSVLAFGLGAALHFYTVIKGHRAEPDLPVQRSA